MPLSTTEPAPALSASRTGVVFFTHRFNRRALDHLRKLQRESAGFGRFFLLCQAGTYIPSELQPLLHSFDFDALHARFPTSLGDGIVPGNPHLAHIDLAEAHPELDHFWIIEYDVHFSGHWRVLFAAFADLPADLLACDVAPFSAETGWYWWPTLQPPAGAALAPHDRWRAFLPCQRISARALRLIATRQTEGWRGHFEALVPTLLHREGYRLVDLGGDGPCVPAGFRHRFYTSDRSPGSYLLRGLPTMRHGPVHMLPSLRRDVLYHPVKQLTPELVRDSVSATAMRWWQRLSSR